MIQAKYRQIKYQEELMKITDLAKTYQLPIKRFEDFLCAQKKAGVDYKKGLFGITVPDGNVDALVKEFKEYIVKLDKKIASMK